MKYLIRAFFGEWKEVGIEKFIEFYFYFMFNGLPNVPDSEKESKMINHCRVVE